MLVLSDPHSQVQLLCRRYAYLGGVDAGGKGFRNPFDRGVVPNFRQFWGNTQPDWAQEYHIGMQDDGAKGSRSWVSAWYARWDLYAVKLLQARRDRMRRREDRLLNGYS